MNQNFKSSSIENFVIEKLEMNHKKYKQFFSNKDFGKSSKMNLPATITIVIKTPLYQIPSCQYFPIFEILQLEQTESYCHIHSNGPNKPKSEKLRLLCSPPPRKSLWFEGTICYGYDINFFLVTIVSFQKHTNPLQQNKKNFTLAKFQ